MREAVLMPRFGQDMQSGRVVAWRKRVGDSIDRGDVLLEVEGDKATMEVEALTSGVLVEVIHDADSEVPVGQILGYLDVSND